MTIRMTRDQAAQYADWLRQWEKIHGRNSTAAQRYEAFQAIRKGTRPSWIG